MGWPSFVAYRGDTFLRGATPVLVRESSSRRTARVLDAELTTTSLQAYVYASRMGRWRAHAVVPRWHRGRAGRPRQDLADQEGDR